MRTLLGPISNPTATDARTGTLTVVFPGQQWPLLMYRLSIGGPEQSICRVYIGGEVSPATFRSISYFGTQDDADYPAGVLAAQGDLIWCLWYSVASPASILAPVPITNADAGVATALAEIAQVQ